MRLSIVSIPRFAVLTTVVNSMLSCFLVIPSL